MGEHAHDDSIMNATSSSALSVRKHARNADVIDLMEDDSSDDDDQTVDKENNSPDRRRRPSSTSALSAATHSSKRRDSLSCMVSSVFSRNSRKKRSVDSFNQQPDNSNVVELLDDDSSDDDDDDSGTQLQKLRSVPSFLLASPSNNISPIQARPLLDTLKKTAMALLPPTSSPLSSVSNHYPELSHRTSTSAKSERGASATAILKRSSPGSSPLHIFREQRSNLTGTDRRHTMVNCKRYSSSTSSSSSHASADAMDKHTKKKGDTSRLRLFDTDSEDDDHALAATTTAPPRAAAGKMNRWKKNRAGGDDEKLSPANALHQAMAKVTLHARSKMTDEKVTGTSTYHVTIASDDDDDGRKPMAEGTTVLLESDDDNDNDDYDRKPAAAIDKTNAAAKAKVWSSGSRQPAKASSTWRLELNASEASDDDKNFQRLVGQLAGKKLANGLDTATNGHQRLADDDDDATMQSVDSMSPPPVATIVVPKTERKPTLSPMGGGDFTAFTPTAHNDGHRAELLPVTEVKVRMDLVGEAAWCLDRDTTEWFLHNEDDDDLQSLDDSVEDAAPKEFPRISIPDKHFQTLKEFQKSGVQWLASLHNRPERGGILGDDMGMGKTYQVCTLLAGLMRAKTIRNALVVMPKSVLRTWENEAKKIFGACLKKFKIYIVLSSNRRRDVLIKKALDWKNKRSKHSLVLATYEMVRDHTEEFTSQGDFDYVVLDEGHLIKHKDTKRTIACRKIASNSATRRLMLTGTPLQNNLTELWCLFDWATSGQLLGELALYRQEFGIVIEHARQKNASQATIDEGHKKVTELQTKLRPFVLQRMKKDCLAHELKGKEEFMLWINMSSKQRTKYAYEVERVFNEAQHGTGFVLPLLAWVKKCCGHPLLVNTTCKDISGPILTEHDAEIEESGKLQMLVFLVKDFKAEGHQTLIFSQSTKMLDVIGQVLVHIGIESFARIDGQTPERERQAKVNCFNKQRSKLDIMLISTKAGGVGLNLTGADRVILYDPSWVPAEDSQAIDRAYRIGQKREVQAYRFVSAGTVEEKMYKRQLYKDGIRRAVFTAEEDIPRYFDRAELQELFAIGPPGVCEVADMAEWSPVEPLIGRDFLRRLQAQASFVGITPHDGYYRANKKTETPFAGVASPYRKKVRVMQRRRAVCSDSSSSEDDESDDSHVLDDGALSFIANSLDEDSDSCSLDTPPIPVKPLAARDRRPTRRNESVLHESQIDELFSDDESEENEWEDDDSFVPDQPAHRRRGIATAQGDVIDVTSEDDQENEDEGDSEDLDDDEEANDEGSEDFIEDDDAVDGSVQMQRNPGSSGANRGSDAEVIDLSNSASETDQFVADENGGDNSTLSSGVSNKENEDGAW